MRTILILLLSGLGCFSQKISQAQEAESTSAIASNDSPEQGRRLSRYPPLIEGARVEVYKNIDGVALNAYIFERRQPSPSPRPAIVFFFGGGWKSGTPAQFEQHCNYFAARGMVALTVDYRVATRQDVKAVACVADAKSAVRWLRKHAVRLGVDPDRIVAAGGSAGGHLAAATGTISGFDEQSEDLSISSVPNALALFNPALVLAPVEGETALDNEKLASLGERMGVEPRELSPYHHVNGSVPPTIIFHGQADTTVQYRTAELFQEAMRRENRMCKLVGFEGATHGFFNFGRDDGEHYRTTVAALDEFLVELEIIAPKETR